MVTLRGFALLFIAWATLAGCHATAPKAQTYQSKSGARAEVRREVEIPASAHAWLEIDRNAFESNVRALQRLLGSDTKLCAVMKADAYGHGIELLIPSVVSLEVPCVGITSNEEARIARKKGFSGRLMRLRAATAEEVEDGLPYEIEECVGNLELARKISEIAERHSGAIRYHLELNSGGMSRNGIELATPREKEDALSLLELPRLQLVGIMTHFPVEEPNEIRRVLERFHAEAGWLIRAGSLDRSEIVLHTASSYATMEVPESHLDLVRVGAALYGDTLPTWTGFKRVMQFKSRVATISSYPKGNSVSYDLTFTLERDSRLANIPVGYSDGYRRVFSNRAQVLIRGRRFPVVGRVTMNTIMVDVTDGGEIQPGDEVVLFGKQGAEEITPQELEVQADAYFADLYTVWGNSNPKVLVAP
jgi:alanine racemase